MGQEQQQDEEMQGLRLKEAMSLAPRIQTLCHRRRRDGRASLSPNSRKSFASRMTRRSSCIASMSRRRRPKLAKN
jgi:hypothetical protein